MEILAIIPARSGSKSIIDKNIISFLGKPLLAHAIEQAQKSLLISRTIVSTDSEVYANIANSYGAETPFLRPKEISQDLSTDIECFQHALLYLQKYENYKPDICVHLRPTFPLRQIKDIDAAITLLIDNEEADSVRSVVESPNTPYKMWHINNGRMQPVCSYHLKDFYNTARQQLPKTYLQNAAIDVVRGSVIFEKESMTGDIILPYIMKDNFDIDTYKDFDFAMQNSKDFLLSLNEFCFDMDGVIASLVPSNNYDLAKPIKQNIEIINWLYGRGKTIIVNTARGFKTGINWENTTRKQLDSWGVKYSFLYMGKPNADLYIDDKACTLPMLQKLFIDSKRRE